MQFSAVFLAAILAATSASALPQNAAYGWQNVDALEARDALNVGHVVQDATKLAKTVGQHLPGIQNKVNNVAQFAGQTFQQAKGAFQAGQAPQAPPQQADPTNIARRNAYAEAEPGFGRTVGKVLKTGVNHFVAPAIQAFEGGMQGGSTLGSRDAEPEPWAFAEASEDGYEMSF